MHMTNRVLRARLLRNNEPGEPNGGGGGATPPNVDGLGDAGKVAIDRERQAAAEAKRERAAEKQRADELQKRLDEFEAANQSEHEKALAEARRQAKDEVLSTANARLVRAEVKAAAAAAGFHDPADAAVQLGARFAEITITDSGDVDEAAAAALVKELAEAKPYLVNTAGSSHVTPRPLPGQGTPPAAPHTGSVTAGADEYRRRHQKT